MIIFRLTNIFIIFYIHIWLYIYICFKPDLGWLVEMTNQDIYAH